MSEARLKSVQCSSPAGLHRIAYKEWGDPANDRVLVCVHGVTRVADDFDALARALCDEYRVVCPDVVGRGRSGRLLDPQLYALPQYIADMVTLIARVTANGDDKVHWFGTSMGGLIGMVLASLPHTPITRLLINDIGPTLDGAALQRIADYIGQDLRFPDYASGARFVREVSSSFGPHSDEQWDKLAGDVLRQEVERRMGAPLRPGAGPAVQVDERRARAAGPGNAVARLGCDYLPDAAGARRIVRPAVARHGAADDDARTEAATGRDCRRRPCADLRAARTDRHRTRHFYWAHSPEHEREDMQITRLHVGKRLSEIAIHNGTIYLAGQIAEDTTQDIEGQTREVLAHVDRLLQEVGSDKTCILMCQIYIADMANFAGMNAVYDEWVAAGHTPPRATVEAKLANPACLVEIVVTAALR